MAQEMEQCDGTRQAHEPAVQPDAAARLGGVRAERRNEAQCRESHERQRTDEEGEGHPRNSAHVLIGADQKDQWRQKQPADDRERGQQREEHRSERDRLHPAEGLGGHPDEREEQG